MTSKTRAMIIDKVSDNQYRVRFSIPETRPRKFDPKADRPEYSYRKLYKNWNSRILYTRNNL